MGRLAEQVVALDALLAQEGGPAPADRDAALAILHRMRELSAELVRGGAHSSHPQLDESLPRLREALDRAIGELRMTRPPEWERTARVPDACTTCHPVRHPTRAADG